LGQRCFAGQSLMRAGGVVVVLDELPQEPLQVCAIPEWTLSYDAAQPAGASDFSATAEEKPQLQRTTPSIPKLGR
jgi:hypothetical protein